MDRKEGLTIEQILSSVEHSEEDNQYTSLRISEDYQPYCNRYSKEDEYQEINLQLEDEADPTACDQQLQIKEESSNDKINLILEESKKDAFKKCVHPQVEMTVSPSSDLNQQQPLIKFKSKRSSENIKKKLSLKKETDEFSKKYDDIFDEIFFNSKSKETKKSDQKVQIPSFTAIHEDSLAKSNASANIGKVNQKVENIIPVVVKEQLNKVQKIPKIVINYQPMITINIKPPIQAKETKAFQVIQELKAPIQVSPKTQIKFSYGKTINFSIPPKKQRLILEFIDFNESQQMRLPLFLRNLRNTTNNYPNFHNSNVFTKQNCQTFNTDIYANYIECKLAINSLKEYHLKIHELVKNIRTLYKKLSQNILIHKSSEDQQLLIFFLSEQWQNYIKCFELKQIQPHTVFIKRPFIELSFFTSLQNYEQIIYTLLAQPNILNHQNPESVKDYMNARDKMWAIQKNLRMMSEELYLYALKSLTIPGHIQQSYNLLKKQSNKEIKAIEKEKDILIERFLFLQQKKDVFSTSWLGNLTISTLVSNLK